MLKKGSSKAAVSKNIATEIKAGKKPAQAIAIAFSVAKKTKPSKGAKPAVAAKKKGGY